MGIPPDRVREIQKISQVSETPIAKKKIHSLETLLRLFSAVAPPDAASDSMLQEQLEQVPDGLADRGA